MHSSNSQRTKVLKVVRREEQVEETLEAVTNTNIQSVTKAIGQELIYEAKLQISAWPGRP